MRYKWCIGQTTHTVRWSDHKSGAMVRPCKWYNGEIIDAVQWSDYTSGAVIRPYIRGAVVRSYKWCNGQIIQVVQWQIINTVVWSDQALEVQWSDYKSGAMFRPCQRCNDLTIQVWWFTLATFARAPLAAVNSCLYARFKALPVYVQPPAKKKCLIRLVFSSVINQKTCKREMEPVVYTSTEGQV